MDQCICKKIKLPQYQTQKKRIKAITGGSVGNLVEWYDWYSYSAFALYFSPVFFPSTDRTAQLLNAAGIFAVGFLMRPIGGWLFGSIADKAGRKKAMTLSILLMSFGSLLIACTPGYASIGVAAPVLLFIARLLQGLSVGGEYGTSATYLSEMASRNRRGFYSSFQYVTLIGGQLIALGIQLLLQKLLLTSEQLHAWGWRIPFIIGAVLAVVAFYIRSNLEETASFEHNREAKENRGTIRELLKYPSAVATVIGLTLGGTIAFYTYSVYMQKFLVNTVKLTIDQSTLISFFQPVVFCIAATCVWVVVRPYRTQTPPDRFWRAWYHLYRAFAYCHQHRNNYGRCIPANHVRFADRKWLYVHQRGGESRTLSSRDQGIGGGFALRVNNAIFGGAAELIALWFKQQGHETWFYWYVATCILISLVVYASMKDTKTHSKITV